MEENRLDVQMATNLTSILREVYHQCLVIYVHSNPHSLEKCEITEFLSDPVTCGITTEVDRSLIDATPLNVGKWTIFFKDVMPTKSQEMQEILVQALEFFNPDMYRILNERLRLVFGKEQWNACGSVVQRSRIATRFGRSMSTCMTTAAAKFCFAIPRSRRNVLVQYISMPESMPRQQIAPASLTAAEFEKVRTLGGGGFGEVLEMISSKTDQHVAVKMLSMSRVSEETWRREIRFLKQASHPNIIRYIGKLVDESAGNRWIIAECMDDSLDTYCTGEKKDLLSVFQRLEILRQCDLGVSHLHSIKIFHRDIKPPNFLVRVYSERHVSAKVCDLGLAGEADDPDILMVTRSTSGNGTPFYFAPEVCCGKRNGARSDMWQMGLVAWELMMKQHFWENAKLIGRHKHMFSLGYIFHRIQMGDTTVPEYPPRAAALDDKHEYPESVRNCVKAALSYDMHLRPTAAELYVVLADAVKSPVLAKRQTKLQRVSPKRGQFDEDDPKQVLWMVDLMKAD